MICPKVLCPRLYRSFFLTLSLLVAHQTAFAGPFPGGRVLEPKFHHLGDNEAPLWPEVPAKPEGTRLDFQFDAQKNPHDYTLALTIWDVNHTAAVQINGKKVDNILPNQVRKEVYVNIPAGMLRNGHNTLTILPQPTDNSVFGNFVLFDKSYRSLMKLETVKLRVIDADTGKAVPARITVTDAKGNLKEVYFPSSKKTAVRPGLVYVAETTEIDLVQGEYVLHATRGMEWSLDTKKISLPAKTAAELTFKLRREVDTKGFVAADTHIHTLTFSRHGDATIDERMVTLAGEGVELAVATDHNHQIDYRPYQSKLGLSRYFTPAVGNEVTTKVGHFNAFPMNPKGPVPDYKGTNWVTLVEGMREHGAKVVILNHPRWSRLDMFDVQGLNPVTGERATGVAIPFDGMELINSGGTRIERLLEDWFALLNYGEKVRAIGASDSHAVTVRNPVGQGRTYVRSSTDDPARINVPKACDTILQGEISVSLGMFADVVVDDQFSMGDLVPASGSTVKVKVRVAAPSWGTPEEVSVYVNGAVVKTQKLFPTKGKSFDQFVTFTIPAPKHDAYIVCVASGASIKEPYWTTACDFTLAATNPVFFDADKDGAYRTPRDTARALLTQAGKDINNQWKVAMTLDDGVGVQFLDLAYKAANHKDRELLSTRLAGASNRKRYSEFYQQLKPGKATASK